jgi:hypothetical protein
MPGSNRPRDYVREKSELEWISIGLKLAGVAFLCLGFAASKDKWALSIGLCVVCWATSFYADSAAKKRAEVIFWGSDRRKEEGSDEPEELEDQKRASLKS